MNGYIVTPNSINICYEGKQYSVSSTSANFNAVATAVREKDLEKAVELVNIANAVGKYMGGKVKVTGNNVYYGDQIIDNVVADRIIEAMEGGYDSKPLCLFLENLMQNPSKRSVDQLYSFLEHKGLPITEDGYILAYKAVRSNYLDKHSGRFDNTPGKVHEMPRNFVDDNPDSHCSSGFHVGALNYVRGFKSGSDRIVICKVNPRDIVSVPSDHNCEKVRCCRYEVVRDYSGPLPDVIYTEDDLETLDPFEIGY